ncbi:MAG: histidine kinase [Bacteroidia bacterium]|nr:histidine kinase [Bacteroidia bacterium]
MIDRIIEKYYHRVPDKRAQSLLLHTLFWVVWLTRSFYDTYSLWGVQWGMVYILIVFVSQAPLVYIHLYWYVPKLLNRKNYLLYILVTALSIYGYSLLNYTLLCALPSENMPERMLRFLATITPNYDLLEGVIVVILTYALKYTLIAFITQNELLKLQKEKLQLELNALKAQIHPHFLFNTLNNLYSLTLKNSDKASEIVLKLSDIMRYVLYQANEEKVSLKKELDFISNYTELQRIRYHDRYDISFKVIGEVENQQIAPLLFIDFVENAFKHGIDKRFSDGFVHIAFHVESTRLALHVSNSIGNNENSGIRQQDAGIGLNNVRKRLAILYPQQHHLDISSRDEVYTVDLEIDLS